MSKRLDASEMLDDMLNRLHKGSRNLDDIFKYGHYSVDRKQEPPSTEFLMKVFRIFDKHGLIRDDLCFDPEHFMETVVREHWNDYDTK